MNVELMMEMRRHIERAEDGSLEPDKVDELLDCALECARLLTLKSMSRGWRELRPELEDERGIPFVYVFVDGGEGDEGAESTWIAIPPMFAEIDAENSYALSPIVPSASAIASQIAQHTPRAQLIANADQVLSFKVLVIHAYSAPVSYELDRTAFLNQCLDCAENQKAISEVGDYHKVVTSITVHDVRADTTHSIH